MTSLEPSLATSAKILTSPQHKLSPLLALHFILGIIILFIISFSTYKESSMTAGIFVLLTIFPDLDQAYTK